jgi:opacity protein-like surface antigen
MKSSLIGIKILFMVVLVLTFLIPINVLAKSPFYISFKPGIYAPQSSDLDETGFNGEIAFGYRFNPYIAGELGIGYFYTEAEKKVVGPTYVDREHFDIDVYPVTLALKVILPYKKWEFFGLAGAGVYIVSAPYDVDDYDYHCDSHHCYYDYDYDYNYDVRLGGFLGAGIHYNITRTIFVGVEGKYLWTDKVNLEDLELKFNMDGIIATAVVGIRF